MLWCRRLLWQTLSVIALERNPTLRQARAQFEATLHRSRQAGLYPNPTLGYIQDQIGSFSESQPTSNGFAVKGKPSPGDNVGAYVQWQIVTAGKLRLSRAKFAEEATAAHWQAIGQELRVLNGVRIQYLEVIAAERLIAIHREMLKLDNDAVRHHGRDAQRRPGQPAGGDPGAHRRSAVPRSRSRRRRIVFGAIGKSSSRSSARPSSGLSHWTRIRSRPRLHHCSFDGTLADLLQNSPEIQAALSEIRRDEIMVRRERVEPIPNVQLQAVTGYNYEFGVQTAGVQIGIALPIFNRNQGTIREAMSDLSRDHAEYERLSLSLRQRLALVFTRYQDAARSVEDFRGGTLPMSRQAYELQIASYRQRRTPWTQVLASRRMYFDLSKDYVESLLELRRAEVEIGGMLLVDGLSSPPSPTSQGHIEAVATPR